MFGLLLALQHKAGLDLGAARLLVGAAGLGGVLGKASGNALAALVEELAGKRLDAVAPGARWRGGFGRPIRDDSTRTLR